MPKKRAISRCASYPAVGIARVANAPAADHLARILRSVDNPTTA